MPQTRAPLLFALCIGPSVVRQLVERFRGRAWVEDAPDGAARFVIEGPGMSIRAPRSDRLGVGGNVSLADARGNYVERGNTTDGPQLGLLRTPPDWNNANYRGPNGQITFRFQHPTAADVVAHRGWNNPFWTLDEGVHNSQLGHVICNLTSNYNAAG